MEPRRILILTALRMEAKALADITGVHGVHVIGIGARRLPPIDPGTCVIVAGLAGGLDPALEVGHVVLDTPLAGLPADSRWHVGPIHTTSAPVLTSAEKAALFAETGALAVDMEQALVRRALPDDVQVIGLRTISDPADMTIDPCVLNLIDPQGRPRPLRLLAAVLKRPRLMQHLFSLKSNSARALRELSRAIRAVLESPTLAARPR